MKRKEKKKKKKMNQFDKFHVMQSHLFHESLELHVTIIYLFIYLFKCLGCYFSQNRKKKGKEKKGKERK